MNAVLRDKISCKRLRRLEPRNDFQRRHRLYSVRAAHPQRPLLWVVGIGDGEVRLCWRTQQDEQNRNRLSQCSATRSPGFSYSHTQKASRARLINASAIRVRALGCQQAKHLSRFPLSIMNESFFALAYQAVSSSMRPRDSSARRKTSVTSGVGYLPRTCVAKV